MAQKEMTTLTTAYLQQLVFFAGEATCHPDANYLLEFERLASPGIVLELAQQVLALRQKEQHESNTCRLNFEQWLEQQRGKIDVDCGCVSTETFMHWLRVAYEAGNYPDIPDGWISCSERMPNDAQWCVVNTEYGYYVQCWSEGQGWLGDDISIPECDVINWMPLPESPKEAK
ncbi:DUF551 domain-containing protein [Escherichia coli]|uniref:DUF551 domain-containing protein n=1 Tax=Escherichia coli TaxID=562 RepID=UPI00208DBD49|nr:DUF551 domain-containing protein [Escherichia coli]